MPLDPALLRTGLISLISDPPKTQPDAARRWADAYHSFASRVTAGPLIPQGLDPAKISSQLSSATPPVGDFFLKMEIGVNLYWTTVSWVGPGFVGIIPVVLGLGPLLVAAGAGLITASDPIQTANVLSQVITAHAATVIVTGTNVATGVTVPFPLS